MCNKEVNKKLIQIFAKQNLDDKQTGVNTFSLGHYYSN